jgi:hypothetical protein
MLQETSPTMLQVDLKADVAVDPFTKPVELDLVEPDVTTLNTSNDCITDILISSIPKIPGQIDTPLDPLQFATAGIAELDDVGVVDVKVTNHSTVFVDTSTTESLIQGGIDLGETYRATGDQSTAIVVTTGTQLRQVDCSASTVA